ncbi:uncharacterized protein ARB_06569 [Trichophyton benhamiae CBS 112371]|uniref:U6 snRNA phosphodiesterase n=1 Tax=Arthroderma benhamiae (strain ATCC MYA-4681 / CBS 112371) TaxID=663331 RepID=D4AQQ9_ARTBC|nr:uncharacterized protein ARB_06569 [Trichophyton benhamiae CBS 112371]EFE34803.1 conserved hypothetical protein [Trichophyton benhamiae CBS 112371]
MSLVQYSDTESESGSGRENKDGSASRSTKRRCREPGGVPQKSQGRAAALPPLPTEFRDLYSTSARISVQDDPSLHNGRTRAIPHVVGVLSNIIKGCESTEGNGIAIHSFLYSDLGAQLPLHISLSRPVVLLTEQRESFLDQFRDYMNNSKIQPFEVSPQKLAWVSNFENTRWFLVLQLNRPANNGLNQLLRLSNSSLAYFGQPPLYESPAGTQKRKYGKQAGHQRNSSSSSSSIDTDYTNCFHISIAWTLEEPSDDEKERLTSIELPARDLIIKFNNVKVKIGNQIYSEALLASIADEAGLEGV